MSSPPTSAETRLAALMERLLAAAEAALAAGDLDAARSTAEDVRTVDPDNERAAEIVGRVVAAQRAPVGERALMTLLFSDIVDSTALSERIEPEVMRDVFARYRREAHAAVERYGGHVVKYLGDGVLAGFGYPQAHEDDARRCVLAGLDLAAGMAAAAIELEAEHGFAPAVRIGIHTGRVVVADLGSGTAREHDSIVGAAANLAARIQGEAPPGTVAISDVTLAMVESDFEVRSLGLRSVKGVTREVEVFVVARPRSVIDRLDTGRYRQAAMVGRSDAERVLEGAWTAVHETATDPAAVGITLLITGEAGIGKSRLAAQLRRRVAQDAGDTLATGCAAYYANIALWPLERLMERALDLPSDHTAGRLEALEEHVSGLGMDLAGTIPLLAPLLGVADPGRYPEPLLDPAALRQARLACVVEWLTRLAAAQPRLLLVEDLHWSDPSTVELLGRLVAAPPHGLLTVMTARTDEALPWASQVQSVPLDRLLEDDAAALVGDLAAGSALDAETLDSIVARAEGIPLFIEELTRSALEAVGEPLPLRLQELLTGRLKAPDVDLRLAQVAATVGASFTADTVSAVIDDSAHAAQALTGLAAAGIIEPEGGPGLGAYHFRHALLRDAAYETQLLDVRQHTHARVAEVLRDGSADPSLVAHHFDLAADPAQAIPFYLAATQARQATGAHAEAITLASRAIELAPALPEGEPRDLTEVTGRLLRVLSVTSTQGYAAPGVQEDQRRAEALTEPLRHRPEVSIPVLIAVWAYWLTNGDLGTAGHLVGRMVPMVDDDAAAWFRPEVESCAGFQSFFEGRLSEAQRHFDTAIAGFKERPPDQLVSPLWPLPNDPYAVTAVALSCIATLQGDLELAAEWEADAVARADACGFPQGPFSRAFVKTYMAWSRQLMGDTAGSQALAAEVIGIGQTYGYAYWVALGSMYLAAAGPGQTPDPVALAGSIAMLHAIGHYAFTAWSLGFLAELQNRAGDVAVARTTIDEALLLAHKTGERLHVPELLRIRAELDLGDTPDEAGADLAGAFEVAMSHGTWLFAVRAAIATATLPETVRPYGWRSKLEDALSHLPARARLDEVAAATALLAR